MRKTVTLKLDNHVYELFRSAARAQGQTVSQFIIDAALSHLDDFDAEMEEILSDTKLLKRLKKGSRDGCALRGKFVD
ncbi:MAG: DUF1778 domain-containing protein [Planctomycetaceae bacterium]|nr:DUF1778 domain-containing protein [Planctomycetaceae bacterium]